jgi:hypothetical protein
MYLESLPCDRASRRCSDSLDFLSLGCTPCDEECTQAGGETSEMKMECKALINQLIRQHGNPPKGAEFFLIRNDHEFGTYYEAGIFYVPPGPEDEDETPSMEYALKCERLPDLWDAEAMKELKEAEHSRFMPKAPARVVKHQGKVVNIQSETA